MTSAARTLVGNRLALAGAAMYFLEWAVIAIAPSLPTDKLGVDPAAIAAGYTPHPGRTGLLAAWLSLVLLGRIAFCVGVREAVIASGRRSPLADWAVGAMTVSVALEIVDYGFVATGAWLRHAHASAAVVSGLDAAGTVFFLLVAAPIGVAVVCSSLALRSTAASRWLVRLGVVAGGTVALAGLVSSAGAGTHGSVHGVGDALSGIGIAAFWLWLVATGIALWRAAPQTERRRLTFRRTADPVGSRG